MLSDARSAQDKAIRATVDNKYGHGGQTVFAAAALNKTAEIRSLEAMLSDQADAQRDLELAASYQCVLVPLPALRPSKAP